MGFEDVGLDGTEVGGREGRNDVPAPRFIRGPSLVNEAGVDEGLELVVMLEGLCYFKDASQNEVAADGAQRIRRDVPHETVGFCRSIAQNGAFS